MRDILFKGKRVDNDEYVEGFYYTQVYLQGTIEEEWYHFIKPIGSESYGEVRVIPESVGQYTGMNEFVMTDKSFNKPLFEGDIVEVWSTRRPYFTNPKSQYDGDIKVRAVIRFTRGTWTLDYDNNYNKSLTKLKGREEDERTVDGHWELYSFGCSDGNEDWHREHNAHYKWDDIVKIGTVFENSELLEG